MTKEHPVDNTKQNVENLPFYIKAKPQENLPKLSTANKRKLMPINVKLKIQNPQESAVRNGFISVPHFGYSNDNLKKIQLVNSDQTIMSFDLFMETDLKEPKKGRKKIFQVFMPGGCFSSRKDDDKYAYTPSSSISNQKKFDPTSITKNTKTAEDFSIGKNNPVRLYAKNDARSSKTFLGKCKPGGCLDPPFSEDKYPYNPAQKPSSIEIENNPEVIIMHRNLYEAPQNISTAEQQNIQDILNNTDVIQSKSSVYTKESDVLITYPLSSVATEEKGKSPKRNGDDNSVKKKESEDESIKRHNGLRESFYRPPKTESKRRTNESSIFNPSIDNKIEKNSSIVSTQSNPNQSLITSLQKNAKNTTQNKSFEMIKEDANIINTKLSYENNLNPNQDTILYNVFEPIVNIHKDDKKDLNLPKLRQENQQEGTNLNPNQYKNISESNLNTPKDDKEDLNLPKLGQENQDVPKKTCNGLRENFYGPSKAENQNKIEKKSSIRSTQLIPNQPFTTSLQKNVDNTTQNKSFEMLRENTNIINTELSYENNLNPNQDTILYNVFEPIVNIHKDDKKDLNLPKLRQENQQEGTSKILSASSGTDASFRFSVEIEPVLRTMEKDFHTNVHNISRSSKSILGQPIITSLLGDVENISKDKKNVTSIINTKRSYETTNGNVPKEEIDFLEQPTEKDQSLTMYIPDNQEIRPTNENQIRNNNTTIHSKPSYTKSEGYISNKENNLFEHVTKQDADRLKDSNDHQIQTFESISGNGEIKLTENNMDTFKHNSDIFNVESSDKLYKNNKEYLDVFKQSQESLQQNSIKMPIATSNTHIKLKSTLKSEPNINVSQKSDILIKDPILTLKDSKTSSKMLVNQNDLVVEDTLRKNIDVETKSMDNSNKSNLSYVGYNILRSKNNDNAIDSLTVNPTDTIASRDDINILDFFGPDLKSASNTYIASNNQQKGLNSDSMSKLHISNRASIEQKFGSSLITKISILSEKDLDMITIEKPENFKNFSTSDKSLQSVNPSDIIKTNSSNITSQVSNYFKTDTSNESNKIKDFENYDQFNEIKYLKDENISSSSHKKSLSQNIFSISSIDFLSTVDDKINNKESKNGETNQIIAHAIPNIEASADFQKAINLSGNEQSFLEQTVNNNIQLYTDKLPQISASNSIILKENENHLTKNEDVRKYISKPIASQNHILDIANDDKSLNNVVKKTDNISRTITKQDENLIKVSPSIQKSISQDNKIMKNKTSENNDAAIKFNKSDDFDSNNIILNFGFQAYRNNMNETIINTYNPSLKPLRIKRDTITTFTSTSKINHELRLAVDRGLDLYIKIKKSKCRQSERRQNSVNNENSFNDNTKKGIIRKQDVLESLTFLYNNNLLPVENAIKKLRKDIEFMNHIRLLLQENLNNDYKHDKVNGTFHIYKSCDCFRH